VLSGWLPLTFGFLALGWLPFALSIVCAGVYPPAAAWLLVVGAIVALSPLPYVNMPFDAAVAWLGIALARQGASSYSRSILRRRRT
jgi:hypothetical protein